MAEIMPTSRSTAAGRASSSLGRRRAPDGATLIAPHPRRSRVSRERRALRKAWWAPLVCGVMLLAGCPPPAKFEEVDAARSTIRFEHPDFPPELSEYAVRRNPRTLTEEHLAGFNGADSLGMLAMIKAGPGYVLPEQSIESSVQRLMPDGAEMVWGGRGGTPSGVGYAPYRFFQITDQSLSCVGFRQSAGRGDDARRSPIAVFGYFCRDGSQPMTAAAAKELLAEVRITRAPLSPRKPPAEPAQ
jgi:hypothetical protein